MTDPAARTRLSWPILAWVLTIGAYCACAYVGTGVCGNDDAREAVYNRMIDGFAKGHLYLARDVPIGFAMLADPYDPEQNSPYRAPPYYLYDLSYYRGRLYAYFGPAPALLLFGPYHLLTGRYLSYKASAVLFCALGFTVMTLVLYSARRRYSPGTPDWLMAALMLILGLSTGLPTLLARVDIWEIPIAAATAFVLCAVAALWAAWHEAGSRARWLAAASLALGLAVATRPTAVLVTPILLLPLIREWREFGLARLRAMLAGAVIPLGICVAALAVYNEARFGNPREFGQTYQLAALQYVGRLRQFGFGYVWDNIRIYFLNFTPWTTTFPFIGSAPKVPLHPGHAEPEFCFGILGNVPVAIMSLTAWAALRRRDGLSAFAAAALWIAVAQIGLLLLFFGTISRYEVEILTPLLCLTAAGILSIEAGRMRVRHAARAILLGLGAASVAFNLAQAAVHADWTRKKASYWFFSLNQVQAALDDYNIMILLEPPKADLHNARGVALGLLGRWNEAIPDFEAAIRLRPDYADAERNLGTAYLEAGRPDAAIVPLRESLRLKPDDSRARDALARANGMLARHLNGQEK